MQYRTLGKTGLRLSEIGFGCGANAVLMVRASYEEQLKAVRHALDSGINYFDTAFAYGLGKSEENLGKILNELGASAIVSTKIRLEPEDMADVKSATVQAVEAGLDRLKRDSVNLIQLHNRITALVREKHELDAVPPSDSQPSSSASATVHASGPTLVAEDGEPPKGGKAVKLTVKTGDG